MYDPNPPDRAPGWRSREREKEKKKRQEMKADEKKFAERNDKKRRDNLERQLRDQREKEGRALSLIVPNNEVVEHSQIPHCGRGTAVQGSSPTAHQSWGVSSRPEYRAELDATSKYQHTSGPYELEPRAASQRSNFTGQLGQMPVQQSLGRRTTQRFELMGSVPQDQSQRPQAHTGLQAGYQQDRYNMAAMANQSRPQQRSRHQLPQPSQVASEGQRNREQKPACFPPGIFENPRTPPKIIRRVEPESRLDFQ